MKNDIPITRKYKKVCACIKLLDLSIEMSQPWIFIIFAIISTDNCIFLTIPAELFTEEK